MSDDANKTPKKPTPEELKAALENLMDDSVDPYTEIADLEAELREARDANILLEEQLATAQSRIDAAEKAAADRAAREIATLKRYAAAPLAKDLFDLADNFQRAADAITPEMRKDPQVDAIAQGFDALKASLAKAFEKHGIKQVEASGAKFDPNFHEGVTVVPAAGDTKPGHVAQVLQQGYTLHDRLLRPARVAVAR
jgi:molecular chaperone GrpE